MNENRTATAQGPRNTRVDMHCHSTASQESRLGVQRAVGLPECATPPEEVYELAKRRGMDFVTITDHDTIAGVLEIADRPDVFVSEELTASFRGESQGVHILCYDITPEDHEWLQAHRDDVELCASYMQEHEIACALAHPYYTVAGPLTARHRRRLAELFAVWEIRNGARAPELNGPAATYVVTRDGIGIGGSDDHAGIDIGRTFTEAPPSRSPQEFLWHMRRGDVLARGAQGSAAKWAHAAIALAVRSLGFRADAQPVGPPDPVRVVDMMSRLLLEADARQGTPGGELSPEDARCLLRAWLIALELDHLNERGLLAMMQDESFSHAGLYRRACRVHERKLRGAVNVALSAATGGEDLLAGAKGIFEASIAAIPYAPATAFLANEQAKLAAIPYSAGRAGVLQRGERRRGHEGELPRVAIMVDGIGSTHGVTRTIAEIRQRGVPGFEIEILGTDPEVDRRLPAVAEIDVPFYPDLRIGVPSLPAAVQTLADGHFDAIHVCSPGPVGASGALLARSLGLPLIGSYHTELTAYAGLRSGDERLTAAMGAAVGAFYGACEIVLSPSLAADQALAAIGVPDRRISRWDRGVDTSRFDPSLRMRPRLGEGPGDADTVDVLYAGRITNEKGVELLADAFLAAQARAPQLRLVLAGGGPEESYLRERLGENACFLGWLEGEALARAYANADLFLFPSATDTFGQVVLEAQASGLPVVAVAAGGPLSLLENRVSGLLCESAPDGLATAMLELIDSPLLRERLVRSGLAAARERTWERALERLALGYGRLLDIPAHGATRAA
jgi:glycosyltransferase involved in cell wall biosynthesis/predicted metal-dependent phosphoesterase TrpH